MVVQEEFCPLVHTALSNQTNQNFFATQTEKFTKKFGLNRVHCRFVDFAPCPNAEPDLWFGSALPPNLGPNFGPVLKSSGLNFGSEPNFSIPNSIQLSDN